MSKARDAIEDLRSIATVDDVQTFTAKPTFGAGVDVTGNIAVTGLVDGRDVAADGVTADAALPKAGGAMTGNITGLTALDVTGTVTATGFNVLVDSDDRITFGVLNGDALINSLAADYGTYQPLLLNGSDVKILTGAIQRMVVSDTGVDVAGTVTCNNTLNVEHASGIATIEVGGTSGGLIDLKSPFSDDYDIRIITEGTEGKIVTGSGVPLVLNTAGVDRVRIHQSTGNVGINAANPQSKLQVAATVETGIPALGADSTFFSVGSASADTLNYGTMIGTVNSGSGYIQQQRFDGTGTAYNLLLQPNGGNVGIGTSSPVQPLSVEGAASNTIDETTGTLKLQATGGNGLLFGTQLSAPFRSYIQSAYTIDTSLARYDLLLNPLGGNVGIGTSSPTLPLSVAGTGQTGGQTGAYMVADFYDTTAGAINVGGGIGFRGNDGVNSNVGFGVIGGFKENATSGNYASYLSFKNRANAGVLTERLRIDSSGNVGIGVVPETAWHSAWTALDIGNGGSLASSPAGQTTTRTFVTDNAYNAGSSHASTWKYKITAQASQHEQKDGKHVFRVAPSGTADATLSWTDAMTVENNGNVLVGKTASSTTVAGAEILPAGVLIATRNGDTMILNRLTTNGGVALFQKDNTLVGNISVNGSSTSYNTSSDYRLKENVTPMVGATATVKLLKPCNFDWISSGDNVNGFLAHELAEVVPDAATGTKDAMRDEEYEVSAATGDVFTAGVTEVSTESQVMETVETGSYVNLAGETIVETTEQGVTTELIETVVQRQDVDGVSTEVEVEVTKQVPTMETVITTEAVAEVIHSADVEQPETLEEGQQWRETTAQVMTTRSVPDMQGIDQAKIVPLLTATIQELIARIETLEAGE